MYTVKRVQLVNGTYEFIQTNEQLANLVGDVLGDDIRRIILDLADQADYTEQKVDTDLESYEASLESNASTFGDIKDILNDSISQIEKSKRLDKDKLAKQLGRIIHMIDTNT